MSLSKTRNTLEHTHYLTKIFYIILCFFVLVDCKNNKEKIKSLAPPAQRPSHKTKHVTLLYSDSTKLKATLKSGEMISYDKNEPEPFIFFPHSIEIIFYNYQQIPTSTLSANQAVYFTKTQKAYLKYNVNFFNDKKEHLVTENLIWNQNTGKITSDKNIKIITPTQIISGKGIECEEDFSDYTIKNITGIIQINDENSKYNQNNESY